MPPYGAINYLNAEADLRDVPLGTYFLFFLNQDAHGRFTRLATIPLLWGLVASAQTWREAMLLDPPVVQQVADRHPPGGRGEVGEQPPVAAPP